MILLIVGAMCVAYWYVTANERQSGSLIQLAASQGSVEERDLEVFGSYVKCAGDECKLPSRVNFIGESVDRVTFHNCNECIAKNCPCSFYAEQHRRGFSWVKDLERKRHMCYLNACGSTCELKYPFAEAFQHNCAGAS